MPSVDMTLPEFQKSSIAKKLVWIGFMIAAGRMDLFALLLIAGTTMVIESPLEPGSPNVASAMDRRLLPQALFLKIAKLRSRFGS